jgi:hypothetical protein
MYKIYLKFIFLVTCAMIRYLLILLYRIIIEDKKLREVSVYQIVSVSHL